MQMKQYLLSVHGSEEEVAAIPPDVAQAMYAQVDAFNTELQSSGAWVFANGLHPASTASVVSVKDGETIITDGPYVETKEHIGGFWIINAVDLDAALAWAAKGSAACMGPVEVRPFQELPDES
jgi:hypothetical protein